MSTATRPLPVIITGASDGIGRSMALAFARRGHPIGLLARRDPMLRKVAEDCRAAGAPRVEISAVDVTHTADFRAALLELDRKLGACTAWFVANAGVDADTETRDDCGSEARRVFDINLTAAVEGIELFKSSWIAREAPGTLVGVSSTAGARGLPHSGIYCASKAGFSAYLESLRIDVRRHGLRVADISPGFIATRMTAGATMPQPFLMECDRAGELFVRDLLRGKERIIHPWQFRPVYWLLRALPGRLYDLIMIRGR